MGKPTEKMVWRLRKMGLPEIKIQNLSYDHASALISEDEAQGGYKKTVTQPEVEFEKVPGGTNIGFKGAFQKPAYNPSSQYVSYSKDIYLALKALVVTEKAKDMVDDKVIMARAIELVKQAIKEFE